MLRYAIVGLGGLGKMHFANLLEIEKRRDDIELVALCDIDKDSFTDVKGINLGVSTEGIDIDKYNIYYHINEMLEKEELDFVISVVPTYVHEEIAIAVLNKGIHVFSEKPMTLTLEAGENMIRAAKENNRILMIGQCLRYWPEYVKLKELIDKKTFGNVIRGEFSRYSPTPKWSWHNWMMDFDKSGGAALDMHVHDVDYINYAFGLPKTISSIASHKVSKYDSIQTHYEYDDFIISSACDWGLDRAFPFSPYFLVRFEGATVEMRGHGLLVYEGDKDAYSLDIEGGNAYVLEILDFIECIKNKRKSHINDPISVKQSLKMALLEMESAREGRKINV